MPHIQKCVMKKKWWIGDDAFLKVKVWYPNFPTQYSCTSSQWPSRQSRGRRRHWTQGRDQRGRQERRRTQLAPLRCPSPVLGKARWFLLTETIERISRMTVSCPKKMLRVAKSSSQALYVASSSCIQRWTTVPYWPDSSLPLMPIGWGCQSVSFFWDSQFSGHSLEGWHCWPCSKFSQPRGNQS